MFWGGDLAAKYRQTVAVDSDDYFLSLAHTARKYWEHPVGKYTFPVRDDGTFRPCDKGQVPLPPRCPPPTRCPPPM